MPTSTSKSPNINENENPFRIPSTKEIFQVRSNEKKDRTEKRKQNLSLPVVDKTTFANSVSKSTIKIRDEKLETKREPEFLKHTDVSKMKNLAEKENMSEYIQQKREMFLLQMSLDSTRREVKKLDEKLEARESKLEHDEKDLEEDVRKFDEFLKSNDVSAVEAMKIAEKETKSRQITDQQNKRLSQKINSLNNERAKYKESLAECMEYKKFLDSLAPDEWKEKIKKKKEEKKNTKHEDQEFSEETENLLGEDFEMYFQDPKQLLDVFSELESRNLTLIQRCQDYEEKLDKLKHEFAEEQAKLETQGEILGKQIGRLKKSIKEEEDRQISFQGEKTKKSEESIESLRNAAKRRLDGRIETIFKEAGIGSDSQMSTLGMLSAIETKLTSVISEIIELPEDFRAKKEKERERYRRKMTRDQKMREQSIQQQERVKRALQRSQEPIKKAVGKPLMYKSVPPTSPRQKKRKNSSNSKSLNSIETNSTDDFLDFLK
eukprot:gb/GECH01006876.1/.p1 GENE.gb/GECH01006876.1/~~gb/GECH01006876.1/.p1  ORF type:complete len:491 (+),score=158.82 gb/GECH01006876.1/:1-1473(+)